MLRRSQRDDHLGQKDPSCSPTENSMSRFFVSITNCCQEECEEIGPTLIVDLEDEDSDQAPWDGKREDDLLSKQQQSYMDNMGCNMVQHGECLTSNCHTTDDEDDL